MNTKPTRYHSVLVGLHWPLAALITLASTGNPLLDQLGKSAHAGLYLLVFAMAASGLATAVQAGLPRR